MSVVVAGYARTPFARYTGALATVPAVELGATAVRAALVRAGVDPDEVQRVIAGQVLQGAAGQNPARQAAVAAGIPLTVPALTLNAVCLSGTEAVAAGAALLAAGEAEIVVALGMESMSLAPHAWSGSRSGSRYGAIELVDTLEHDGLTDAFEHRSMGASTEDGNSALGIDRAAQDAWAAASHQRAEAARPHLAEEIVPVEITGRRPTTIRVDDGVRPDTTAESLAALRPAFGPDGTITAGNASQITDGAAALVLMTAAAAAARGLTGLATVEAHALVAGPDVQLHAQPAAAIRSALARRGWTPSDLHVVEINEAFAAVAVHSVAALGVDPGVVNRWGGAIALGHPIGASGARIVGTLAAQLAALHDGRDGLLGAAGICGGGGQGSAIVLRSIG